MGLDVSNDLKLHLTGVSVESIVKHQGETIIETCLLG